MASPRLHLTLNLGLRYDIQVPRTEAKGNISTVDPTLPNPAAGGLPGAFAFYGKGPGRNGKSRIGNIGYLGFQPRIGYAYSPGPEHRTAFRGGFAITRPLGNDNLGEQEGSGELAQGFAGIASITRIADYVGSPAYYWDNAYPASGINGPMITPGYEIGNANQPLVKPSAGIPPTQLYWTQQVQQQFSPSVIATIGYVGMHTYRVGVWSKPNQVNSVLAQQKYGAAAAAAGIPLNQLLALPITDPRVTSAGITSPWPGFVFRLWSRRYCESGSPTLPAVRRRR